MSTTPPDVSVDSTAEAGSPERPVARTVMAGALIGAAVGAALAYAFARREAGPPRLSTGKAIKLGMLLLGTMRQAAAMLEEEVS